MAANLKKASSVIRNSFRSKRYIIFDAKENNYILSPRKSERPGRDGRLITRSVSTPASSSDENESASPQASKPSPKHPQSKLKRTTSVTQSMRVAVGTLRQKLKKSSRRGQLQTTPKRAGKGRLTTGSHEVRLYSPFKIDTPTGVGGSRIKNITSLETPTRLRREVESLTANMRALSALTPNTLQGRSRARKSPTLPIGSLRTTRSPRKRIVLEA